MNANHLPLRKDFSPIVRSIGSDLAQTQVRIASSANADMLFHYWKVGTYILYLQEREGWGGKVVDKLSQAIRAEYPDKKGYSRRNIFYMCQFASAYPLETLRKLHEVEAQMQQPSVELVQQLTKQLNEIVQQPVAQIQSPDNEPSIITQQPIAQIQSISETLHNGIHIDLSEVKALFR